MNLEVSHWILIATTISGYAFALIQYFLKRKQAKKSLIAERKYIAYSNVLKKFDEVNKNIRINSAELLQSSADVFTKIISSNSQDEMNSALIQFNKKLNEQTTKAFQPLTILKEEQYSLKLLYSDKLKAKIEEYISIADRLFSKYNSLLSNLSIENAESIKEKFDPAKEDNDWQDVQNLVEEIIQIMRDEINDT